MNKIIAVAALALAAMLPTTVLAEQSAPQAWNFSPVSATTAGQKVMTVLTGINNLKKATGYYQSGQNYIAFAAEEPYAAFTPINNPGYASCIASALTNNYLQVGYCLTPGSTVGYARYHGAYFTYPSAGSMFYGAGVILCPNAGMKCHGEDRHSDRLLVGAVYRVNTANLVVPSAIQYDYTTRSLKATYTPPFMPATASTVASGMNGRGEVCGWYTASGVTQSWFHAKDGTYYPVSYPGAVQTWAWAVNWEEIIVGTYLDTNGDTHGFVLSYPERAKQTYQSVDYPGATSTVIRSINDPDDMVGSYVDASGATHGFLAVPAQ